MQLSYNDGFVIENREIEDSVFSIKIRGEFKGEPGQFYMLRAWDREPVLGRPISIHKIDEEGITFLYQVKGAGTRIIRDLKKDERIKLLGPMGNGFKKDYKGKRVAVVTGGIGIAPMLHAVSNISAEEIHLYAGFRDKDYILAEFEDKVDKIYTASESGLGGHKGYITELLKPERYDAVLCCGPEAMMTKVAKMCIESGVDVYVSLESHMACGIGACLACTCKTKYGNKRVCKEGPVFHGKDVFIDA